MKFVPTSWLGGVLLVVKVLSTTGHSIAGTGLPALPRDLQSSSSAFTIANPRAPLHGRTPDGVAAPNSISRQDLEALLLAKAPPNGHLLGGSSSSTSGSGNGGDDDDDDGDRRRFLWFVVLVPTLSALVAGACVLFCFRAGGTKERRSRDNQIMVNETEGLFQTRTGETATHQERPYYQDVPEQGYAEQRPNVI